VGSTLVQFDLRFYVVALVFIVFEVEVALFFPPATIFGKATQLMNPGTPPARAAELREELGMAAGGDAAPERSPAGTRSLESADARSLAAAAMLDLGAFFAVILVAFAYLWWRGDLDWVRALGSAAPAARSENERTLGLSGNQAGPDGG
jgi:NADH-quinone oxidoreductase subunit A